MKANLSFIFTGTVVYCTMTEVCGRETAGQICFGGKRGINDEEEGFRQKTSAVGTAGRFLRAGIRI